MEIRSRTQKYLKKQVFEAVQASEASADGALHHKDMQSRRHAVELRRRFDSTGVELRAPVRDVFFDQKKIRIHQEKSKSDLYHRC